MLQLYIGELLLLGLTKVNVDRLQQGMPIVLQIKKEGMKEISIMYGETKVDIIGQLEKSGAEIPDWMWDSVREDPT